MTDEPSLPPLPAVAWNPETESFSNNTRKRARDATNAPPPPQFSTSSDPAVFSSDDDPNVDNYIQGRHKKKRYVGSWYQQHPASSDSAFSEEPRPLPKKAQRTFQRQFDSGVWMGSDGFTEDEDTIIEPEFSGEPRLPQLSHTRAKVALSPAEEFARRKIQEAIDTGDEVIDLTDLDLEELSSETISQLSEFSCIPLVAEDVPFEQRDPALKLYLAQNPLPRAPGAIFNLEFLTVLSLRNTQITELPPSIGNLRNLTDLNISLNRLEYLPGELLDLLQYPGKLLDLRIHPNPFYHMKDLPSLPPFSSEPFAGTVFEDFPSTGATILHEQAFPNGEIFRVWLDENDGLPEEGFERAQTQHLNNRRWQMRAIGRSPVQYSDSRGTILSRFQLPGLRETSRPATPQQPSQENVVVETEDLESTPTPVPTTSTISSSSFLAASSGRVPSLFETALKACARSGQLADLPSYLSPHTPPQIPRVLRQLAAQAEDNGDYYNNNNSDAPGAVPCAVCHRRVMVPTTAWVEWWDVGRSAALPGSGTVLHDPVSLIGDERAIPFLRRGCCWRTCVPRPMKLLQLRPGSMRWSLVRPDGEGEGA